MPELYIITGSNGAGKSSIGPDYLPTYIRQKGLIFDGDKLFVEKRNELWRTIKSHKECCKLAYAFVTETFDNLFIRQQNGRLRSNAILLPRFLKDFISLARIYNRNDSMLFILLKIAFRWEKELPQFPCLSLCRRC